MAWIFLLILVGWPAAEIAVFLKVGEAIGFVATIFLFVAAGAIGLALLRAEGFSLLVRAQKQMNEGIVPVREGFDALCLAVSGVLLVLPGFISDVLALLLILSPVRGLLRRALVRWRAAREREARVGPGLIIEGDYEDLTRRAGERPDEIVHRRD